MEIRLHLNIFAPNSVTMAISPSKINWFLMLKLPIAFLAGVRVVSLSEVCCVTAVKFRWINQNPFKSMFWAVQGMAAELSTGALVMSKIDSSDQKISMLVVGNKATFEKKAKGKITFTCNEGEEIDRVLEAALASGDGQTVWLQAKGRDEAGDIVSTFFFQWSLKKKSTKG